MDGLLLRKGIAESIGTFFLVFVIGCVSMQEHILLGPLAIGAALMVMIFAGATSAAVIMISQRRYSFLTID